jgi:hypothetical protein
MIVAIFDKASLCATDAVPASPEGRTAEPAVKPWLGFLSIFLLGLVSGVSLSHLLQRDPKVTLSGVQFLAVQQVLVRNYGPVIGGLEIVALFSTLAMAIVTWGEPAVSFLATLASGCVLLMMIIWAAWINCQGCGFALGRETRNRTSAPWRA